MRSLGSLGLILALASFFATPLLAHPGHHHDFQARDADASDDYDLQARNAHGSTGAQSEYDLSARELDYARLVARNAELEAELARRTPSPSSGYGFDRRSAGPSYDYPIEARDANAYPYTYNDLDTREAQQYDDRNLYTRSPYDRELSARWLETEFELHRRAKEPEKKQQICPNPSCRKNQLIEVPNPIGISLWYCQICKGFWVWDPKTDSFQVAPKQVIPPSWVPPKGSSQQGKYGSNQG
ncbi:hypothetical protein MMC19_000227 [Ptychographa xylographoides]|nr:hypothetical protein [Ptychographa xylographoides]